MSFEKNDSKVTAIASEQPDELLLGYNQQLGGEEQATDLSLLSGAVAIEPTVNTTETHVSKAESLVMGQKAESFRALQSVVDVLNHSKYKKHEVKPIENQEFSKSLKEWLSEDKLAYVNKAMEADPELSFTLVATPNLVLTRGQLYETTLELGKNRSHPTYVADHIEDDIYAKYSPVELHGTEIGNENPLIFSLIPTKLNEGMEGTVSEQRARLAELQKENQFLRVPTILEAVTLWELLGNQGVTSETPNVMFKTYVRHFNLPEQKQSYDDSSCVPESLIRRDGHNGLYFSNVSWDRPARIAVG